MKGPPRTVAWTRSVRTELPRTIHDLNAFLFLGQIIVDVCAVRVVSLVEFDVLALGAHLGVRSTAVSGLCLFQHPFW